jgi:hypothetical protein
MNVGQVSLLELEDDLNSWANGRRPQFFGKWKTTSILWQNGRQPQFFAKMEDNLNSLAKWKTTSILR